MNKSQALASLFAVMSEVYDKQLTDAAQSIWASAMKEFSGDQIMSAIEAHMKDPGEGRFAPKPASIIGKITGTSKQLQISQENKALEAWDLILKAIRERGAYRPLQIDDKHAMAAIQSIGGWVGLCHTPSDKMEWRRKEFLSAYSNFNAVENLPKSLAGIGQKSQDKIEARNALERINQGVNK